MRTKNQISQSANVSKKGGNTNINQNKIIIEMPKPIQRRQYAPRKKSISQAEQELQNLENQDAGYRMGNPINVSVVQPPTINPSVFGYSHLPVGRETQVIPAPPEYNPPPPEYTPPIDGPAEAVAATGKRRGRPVGSRNRPLPMAIGQALQTAETAEPEGYYSEVGGLGLSTKYSENPLAFKTNYGKGFNEGDYRSDFEQRRMQQAQQDFSDSGGKAEPSKPPFKVKKIPKLTIESESEYEIPTRIIKRIATKKNPKVSEDIIPPPTPPTQPSPPSSPRLSLVKPTTPEPQKAARVSKLKQPSPSSQKLSSVKPAAPEPTKEQKAAEKAARISQIKQKRTLRGMPFNA